MANNNSFPKQYILDRIDARVARIRSFQATDDAVLKQSVTDMAVKDAAWVQDVPAELDALKHKARVVAKRVASAAGDTEKVIAAAQDLSAQLRQLENVPPSRRSRGYNYKETDFDKAVTVAVNRRPSLAKELVALEHARAYLEDTPVAEFSWTALKALGLIDAVKFDLTAAVDARAVPARRR